MFRQGLLLNTIGRRQRRRFLLRNVQQRCEREVRMILGEAAAEVEARLKKHVRLSIGYLPADWLSRIQRQQLVGDGRNVPDMVGYLYQGQQILTVRTRVVGKDLSVDIQGLVTRRAWRRAQEDHQPMIWDRLPWGALMVSA